MRHDLPREEVVFVAAHPDDEVIGAGGQLVGAPSAWVVHVTDGAPRDMADAHRLGFSTREAYAAARRAEALEALGLAGLAPERVVAFEAVDQEAVLALPVLVRRLAALIQAISARVIFTHPYEGGHPDHDAAAFVVHAARALLARQRPGPPPDLYEFTSYHADTDGVLRVGVFLAQNQAACGPAEERGDVTVDLSAAARLCKQRMLAAHRSQARVLASFPLDVERFRRAPAYRFGVAPHPGSLHYERMGWAMPGARWRSLAHEALRALRLPDEPL